MLIALSMFLATTFAFAQAKGETVTLKGTIIDNMCAGQQTPKTMPEFIKTHKKECALMDACIKSGYSLVVGDKLYRFDSESSGKILNFLKRDDSKLNVEVVAKVIEPMLLSVVSVKNQ